MYFDTTIGTKLMIQVESDGTRFISFLVGYLKEDCILVTTPSSNNTFSLRPMLFVGCKINVRYIQDGRVVGFQTRLLRAIEEPLRLLFLSYPKQIEDRELRAEKRVACTLPAEVSILNLDCNAIIVDINQIGLRILIKESEFTSQLDSSIEGQECTLRFFLPGNSTQLEVSGNIRNYEQNNQRMAFGIKITDISDAGRQSIIDFESKINV
ncbi:MAG: flagellar brake protein [Syntrophaceae bacterium]|nr:flagellar brake protein [Syntrophaceae bacterium]